MRTIRISDKVWNEIAKRGNFGDTVDDVLRREFEIRPTNKKPGSMRRRIATRKMGANVEGIELIVEFLGGPLDRWTLPSQDNKMGIRKVRDEAVAFAKQNGATEGQVAAVKKALTSAGYHLTK